MTPSELLSELRQRDVRVWADGDQLKFSAKKGALTADLFSALTERKAEILAYLQDAERAVRPSTPLIEPTPRDAPVPMSFAQQRIWFLEQLQPGTAAYHVHLRIRLNGALDVATLSECLREIQRRHESLRTTFDTVDGDPIQVIAPEPSTELVYVDLTSRPHETRQREIARLGDKDATRPFDLTNGPLLRTTLVQLGPAHNVLLLTMHHIVSDGWSMKVFFRELAELYGALQRDQPSPLAPLPIQYADFAQWQREWLTGPALNVHLHYWREQLDGRPSVLELPTDRPRPAVKNFRGASEARRLPVELTEAMKEIGRAEGTTLFMTLLAAFQVLLHRYTGQDDILVGTPVAGRNRVEIEGLIGFFVNTLVIRTDLGDNPSFRGLLGRVRDACLGAFSHQDLPFEKLVEELEPDRHLDITPIFQTMFVLVESDNDSISFSDLTLERLPAASQTAKFDLTLSILDTPDGFETGFEYDTDLFDAATIKRMLDHFQVLLAGIAADPGQRIHDVPILSDRETRQLLDEWNDQKKEYPVTSCLHEMFHSQVQRAPDAVAVALGRERLTYRELNTRANQMAHHLRRAGVGPDVLVALYLERSLEMVIAILGVGKAGGAYLPIDLAHPAERIAFMLRESEAKILLTQRELADRLTNHELELLCLDSDWELIAANDTTDPPPTATPENLAYVIYTSGSTGLPKGTLVTHANVVRLLSATQEWFQFSSRDVWTMFHSYAFDFSVWELWGALCHGGRLVVVPYWVSRSPEDFYHLLCAEGVTVLNQTPSAFSQLMRVDGASEGSKPLQLRLVIFGGEALNVQSLEPWFARHGDGPAQLVNMYGITETTVHVTYRRITQADLITSGSSPIGRPIPDLQVYVFDSYQKLVPPGVPGEMYVGGAGVARGYLKRPELTAERFVADRFSAKPHGKLYKTGDVGRWLPDGSLEYLGRRDHQVKLRGLRIELGEIEAVLVHHSGVEQSVVLMREDRPGDQRLVAYVVLHRGGQFDVDELRQHVAAKLPDYMVPAAFVVLDELPQTPNGKIDRRALPAPGDASSQSATDFVVPRGILEARMLQVWEEVLGTHPIGVHDNFFHLGGHSLLAIRVVAQVQKQLGKKLPVAAVFQAPTIAELTERCRSVETTSSATRIPTIAKREGLPLSFAQQRLWFLEQLQPGTSVYNIPSAVRVTGKLNVEAFERSLLDIQRRHESLRTSFQTVEGSPVQVISGAASLKLERTDLSDQSVEEREDSVLRLANEEARRPFELTRAPLIRAALLKLSEDEHILLLTMHHIVSDGWSMEVLTRELVTVYEALVTDQPSPLPELPIQCADYAVWQRETVQDEWLERELSYWREQLRGAPPLELPFDRPRPPVQTFSGAVESLSLPAHLINSIKTLCHRERSTLFMAVLAAYQTLLFRYTGQEDIVVGSPVAGRERAEVEGLIGFFVNTLTFRTDLSGNPTFRELLARVRNICLEAYSHQDLPFEKLVEELEPDRNLGTTPIFQTLFIFQEAPQDLPVFSDLTLRPLPVHNDTTKFDLTFSVGAIEDALSVSAEFNTALFDTSTIKRMLEHFQVLLEGIAVDPDRSITSLPILTAIERKQLLDEWNDTAREYPCDRRVHQLFEAQAVRIPERIAAECDGERLTYRRLEERADQLARHLRNQGVGAECRVGIYTERSLDMLVAVLGVLKSGSAYVPLDPEYPRDRLRFMIEDSDLSIILTQRHLAAEARELARTMVIDDELPPLGHNEAGIVADAAKDVDLAYVIYTSGSTGKPKGVEVAHRAVVNFLTSMLRHPGVTGDDTLLAVTTLSFDISVLELLLPLVAGGRVVIATSEIASDGRLLSTALGESGATVMQATPATWQMLIDSGWERSAGLKALCGGEPLSRHLADSLLARVGSLWNMYGPTETTVWSAVQQIVMGGEPITIGQPIANTQLYILDRQCQPVPIGAFGELHIGGDGLACGYWKRGDLTAAKFIADPFSDRPGCRLYKTGDLARRRNDGAIEVVGRIDHQVKLRGFRIELGEIESALAGHLDVAQNIVVAREDRPGDKRLVAYVVSAVEGHPQAGELREHLRKWVPDYMVPSAFVMVDALPLTPSGKVDRRALPAPAMGDEGRETGFVTARTPAEQRVADVWAEVLGLPRVSIRDNFFAVGGHSLLATKVVASLSESFDVEIPLRTLFEAPTVDEFVVVIMRLKAEQLDDDSLSRMLGDLENMSDEELKASLDLED